MRPTTLLSTGIIESNRIDECGIDYALSDHLHSFMMICLFMIKVVAATADSDIS